MPALDPSNVGSAMPQPGDESGINPLIRVRSNAQIAADDKAAAMAQANQAHISRFASWLRTKWEASLTAKTTHEQKMLKDFRQRDGQYDPEDLALIQKTSGSTIYMMLTATKCRAAAAWIKDVLLPSDDHPWGLDPTPIPELMPEVAATIEQAAWTMFQQDLVMMLHTQGFIDPAQEQILRQQATEAIQKVKDQVLDDFRAEAKERSGRMEDKIEDQLIEGGFYTALEECIDDLVTYPAAILKGPIIRREKKLIWAQGQDGRTVAQVEEVLKPRFTRVSCFDLYPLPNTVDIQKGGFFEREKLTVDDLSSMIGVPGYSEKAIRAAIDDYGKSGLNMSLVNDSARAMAEGRTNEYLNQTDTIDCLEFWGRVPGTLLLEFGMDETQVPDRSKSYEANVWLVGQYVIRAALNPHPTGKRPYGIASYEKVPGQIWGKGIPRLIRDCQRICNACGRAIANNMAIASGPQVAIRNINRIPVGESITEMYPWKVWQFTADEMGRNDPPVDFFQPSMVTDQLLEIFGYFSRLADDYSGVIAAAYGSDDAAGAGKTASGQAMLLTNASKVLAGVIGNVDRGIVVPVVEGQFVHNMLFDDDESIKGDLFVTAKGSSKLVVKEQAQMRRNEFLALSNNPTDMQIIGLEGRRAILEEVAKTLQLNKDIVPTEEELMAAAQQIAALQQQAAIAAQPQQPPQQ